MHIKHLHEWNISASEAIALQKQMVADIDFHHPIDLKAVKLVAGVDVSVKPDPETGKDMSQAAVVVLSFPDMQVVETSLATLPTPFPYIPGLLSFREGPVLEMAFAKLQAEPDVLIFDGMGRAHPRRIGIASHMGLWLQKPSIGCGKTLFVGKFKEPGNERGDFSDLIDKGEVIGAVLRTRANVKPVFISVGHLADLPTSLKLVMLCTSKYRLPDPIRAAHNAAGKFE
ncbi:MAG: deoxyribonuclease V [Chloroflexi bacterium]|nr:deoxyribonuclease V [Chloroflexota bacterium]